MSATALFDFSTTNSRFSDDGACMAVVVRNAFSAAENICALVRGAALAINVTLNRKTDKSQCVLLKRVIIDNNEMSKNSIKC